MDQWMRANKHEFTADEPIDNRERFEKRLAQQQVKKKTHRLYYAAAAVVGVLLITAVAFDLGKKSSALPSGNQQLTLMDISADYKEVEQYYQQVIESQKENFQTEGLSKLQPVKTAFKDLNKLEQQYQELQLALATTPNDERVIQGMIMNYRMRIVVLQKLEKIIQNQTQRKHDKVSA